MMHFIIHRNECCWFWLAVAFFESGPYYPEIPVSEIVVCVD